MYKVIEQLKNALIVSCQADKKEPLYGPEYMSAMARSAEIAGAAGVRINGFADIAEVRKSVNIPIIGIIKLRDPETRAYITPDFLSAEKIVDAGADIVALDVTNAYRKEPVCELIYRITEELKVPVFADISNFDEGIRAASYGASIIATTLSSYRTYNNCLRLPDLELVGRLARSTSTPVVCEGGIKTPEDVASALQAGAWAVVVGAAITKPIEITKRFAMAIKDKKYE